MEWLIELLSPNNLTLASTILLYSFVIFAGIYLGKPRKAALKVEPLRQVT